MVSAERERHSGRCLPQPGDHGELLLEAVEALAGGGERDAVGAVLVVVPPGPQPQLHPPAAHRVDLRDGDGQRPWQAEGGRRQQRAEPDPGGLPGEPTEGHPRVGRPGPAVARADAQEVVGAEERVEAGVLGGPRDPEQVVVCRTLLRLGEYAQVHRPTVSQRLPATAPGGTPTGRCQRR